MITITYCQFTRKSIKGKRIKISLTILCLVVAVTSYFTKNFYRIVRKEVKIPTSFCLNKQTGVYGEGKLFEQSTANVLNLIFDIAQSNYSYCILRDAIAFQYLAMRMIEYTYSNKELKII